jgi:hypothetical protein
VLAGGTARAVELRADEREVRERREAAAALARAEADYRGRVRAVAGLVYDHVQPLFQADRYFDEGKSSFSSLVDDVLLRGGAGSAVAARNRELAALEPPTSLRAEASALETDLEVLAREVAAVGTLPSLEAVASEAAFDRYLDLYLDRFDALARAVMDWNNDVARLFADEDYPPRPQSGQLRDGTTAPVSKGAYLYTAGDACAAASRRIVELPTSGSIDAVRAAQAKNLVVAERAVRLLVGVKAPAKDRPVLQRTVVEPLQRFVQSASQADDFLDALQAGDAARAQRLAKVLVASDSLADKAARGLRAYGSTTCGVAISGDQA